MKAQIYYCFIIFVFIFGTLNESYGKYIDQNAIIKAVSGFANDLMKVKYDKLVKENKRDEINKICTTLKETCNDKQNLGKKDKTIKHKECTDFYNKCLKENPFKSNQSKT
ncbi:uncharacterized protein LOC128965001 [Oppia nitens]|uniref:uncharacterized protein LOC128965001 n=1 Tax=Oppia nitens TaxID=1686743 RepID=UPI0023DB4273|nr:uncharacterized protein LOC128965001 [Oppia nitens]